MASPERGFIPEAEKTQDKLAERIADLKSRTEQHYTRTELPDGTTELKAEKETLRIEGIKGRESPLVEKGQKMLLDKFGEEEVDPPENLREAFDWNEDKDRKVLGKFSMDVATNAEGKTEGVGASTYIPTRSKGGRATGEGIVQVSWLAAEKDKKLEKIGTELYARCLEGAGKFADERQEKINMVVIEAGRMDEAFLNSFGCARAYFRNKEGKMEEIKYTQPPLDFDTGTGEVDPEAGDSPNHLMMSMISGEKQVTRQQIIDAVRGMYQYNNLWDKDEDWDTAAAYEKAKQLIMGKYLGDLEKQLKGVDHLELLTEEERQRMMMEENVEFIEYKEGD